MDDFEDDTTVGMDVSGADQAPDGEDRSPADAALVKRIMSTIRADKEHHKSAFEAMQRSMFMAMHGRDKDWSDKSYRANICGRHVKQKTAALYAKNPKVVARRRETLDFAVWDENPDSFQLAVQIVQTAAQMQQAAAQQAQIDPRTGQPVSPVVDLPQGFQQAQELIADVQQGLQRRQQVKRLGRTLEVLFENAMREQKPLNFKMALKQVVRRACTTGVGYVELDFQRETGPRPGVAEQLADARARLAHLERLQREQAEGEVDGDAPERAELEHAITALMSEPEIVLREGLIFDYPQSTKVIPDKLCKSLVGFVGARHLTIEYVYTKKQVEELYGVDLGQDVSTRGEEDSDHPGRFVVDEDTRPSSDRTDTLVRVWKHYDKASGLVYHVADGHKDFLRAPAQPSVFVEDFWPVYALTFNAVESEDELFPPSDVELLSSMQREHNRSRQGKREHRQAARPRWGYPKGMLDEQDIEAFKRAQPFDCFGLNIDPQSKLQDVLQAIPVPGVDPNLYDTNEVFTDAQLVVGAQEAQLGGISQATATESAIAANSSASSDGSSVDDLNDFLTCIARSSGQILMRELSEEQAKRIAGIGAFWPPMTLAEVSEELALEVEAGSTGKPNQAVEINNWKELLPYLIQVPGVQPMWLARETLRRLDDRMDLTEALAAGLPAIVAQNRMSQPAAVGDPAADPTAQGAEGADKGQRAPGNTGSGPAFGSNQV